MRVSVEVIHENGNRYNKLFERDSLDVVCLEIKDWLNEQLTPDKPKNLWEGFGNFLSKSKNSPRGKSKRTK